MSLNFARFQVLHTKKKSLGDSASMFPNELDISPFTLEIF